MPDARRGWVFGGASGRSYSDNASVLHQHLRQTRPDVNATWVIDRDSPDRRLIEQYGSWAPRGSLHAHRLTSAAEVIVFSHGIHDVPGLLYSNRALRVRLGHGLTAFGRTRGRLPRSTRRMTKAVALAPVASRMEQDHKLDWGFARDQLPITGLPRWDAMVAHRNAASDDTPRVLYAPTSRPWHTDADASPTGALRPIHDFLHDPRLQALVESGTFELAVYFHQITRHRFGEFSWLPRQVRIITDEAELPALIAGSRLVISDYSSILWDALYVDVPVLFFQFDRDEHEQRRGSYLDLRQRLFGPNAQTAAEVVAHFADAVEDGFTLADWAADRTAWQERAFAHRDANNCQRVLEAIDACR